MVDENSVAVTRRGFMRAVGLAGVGCVAGGGVLSLPAPARAADEVEAAIAAVMGSGEMTTSKVTLDMQATAENGALVRVPIKVESPMKADDYIQSVAIFVDANPKPLVARFDFTPEAGTIQFEIRIKMAKASKVRAIAKNNKGQLFAAVKEVQVAEGGCAG